MPRYYSELERYEEKESEMRDLLKTKLAKVLIAVVIAALVLGGGLALAVNTIWLGTASITIEVSEPAAGGGGGGGGGDGEEITEPAPLTAGEISVTMGLIENGVWTVTLIPGDNATLQTHISNPRDTEAWVELLTNGSTEDYLTVAPGVAVKQRVGHGVVHSIDPGVSLIVEFIINVQEGADTGALPDIALEIREKE